LDNLDLGKIDLGTLDLSPGGYISVASLLGIHTVFTIHYASTDRTQQKSEQEQEQKH